jgi:protein-disulfide isomerase
MPTKAKSSKANKATPVEASPAPAETKRRPNLGFLRRINIVYVLFFLLIIASFLIGVLVTQVQYLKKGTTVAANDVYAGDPAAGVQQVGPVDVDEGHLPILGNKDAKVTLVEFSDFQCPFCEQLYKDALPQIKKEYIDTGKVKMAYRQYPLTSLHPNAQKAAEASECANDQGKFWDYHDQLFDNQADWEALTSDEALNKFVEYANAVGINGEELRSCVSSDKMAKKVQEDVDAGTKVGVDGTPASFVNGILISGAVPFSDFKTQIDAALAEK